MGISGKHVLKAFGEFKDIKVRYVAPVLRTVAEETPYSEKLGTSAASASSSGFPAHSRRFHIPLVAPELTRRPAY